MSEKLKKNGDRSLFVVFLILIFLIVYVIYLAFTTVKEFIPANHKQVEIVIAKETLTVTNAVMIIPIGKDHYYVGIDENENCYLIRAGAGWFKRNFDSSGFAKEGSIVISAPIRGIRMDLETPLNDQLSEIRDFFPNGYREYYYVGYLFEDGLKLCFLLSLLATVIILIVSHILNSRKSEFILEFGEGNIPRTVRNPKWDGTLNWNNRLSSIGFKLLFVTVILMIIVMWRFK